MMTVMNAAQWQTGVGAVAGVAWPAR
jgi:hypothetical protein